MRVKSVKTRSNGPTESRLEAENFAQDRALRVKPNYCFMGAAMVAMMNF